METVSCEMLLFVELKAELNPRPMKGGGTSKAWLFSDFDQELGFEAADDGCGLIFSTAAAAAATL